MLTVRKTSVHFRIEVLIVYSVTDLLQEVQAVQRTRTSGL